MFGSSKHLRKVHNPTSSREVVDALCDGICRLQNQMPIDAVAFRGVSGAAVGYPIQYQMGIPVVNVRKSSDDSHTMRDVESCEVHRIASYIIVDDLIDSGDTMREIMGALSKRGVPLAACKAILLYADEGDPDDLFYTFGLEIPVYHLSKGIYPATRRMRQIETQLAARLESPLVMEPVSFSWPAATF